MDSFTAGTVLNRRIRGPGQGVVQAIAIAKILDIRCIASACLGNVVQQVAEQGFRHWLAQNVLGLIGQALNLAIQLNQQGQAGRPGTIGTQFQRFGKTTGGTPELLAGGAGTELDQTLNHFLHVAEVFG